MKFDLDYLNDFFNLANEEEIKEFFDYANKKLLDKRLEREQAFQKAKEKVLSALIDFKEEFPLATITFEVLCDHCDCYNEYDLTEIIDGLSFKR